jgi:hypothetical protein
MGIAKAHGPILLVPQFRSSEKGFQAGFERSGERDETVFSSLAIMHRDGALTEVDVLDPESERFPLAEAATIHEFHEEFPGVVEVRQDLAHFLAREHDGRAAGAAPCRRQMDQNVFVFEIMDVPG